MLLKCVPEVREWDSLTKSRSIGETPRNRCLTSALGPPATPVAAIPHDSESYETGVPIHAAFGRDSVGCLPSFVVFLCFLGKKYPLVLSSFNE